ncbi:serine recombinase [Dyella jiangningensis]|nr:serine recombinase [Dyella jiangningensis]AHX15956.1 serine recombinase [Dyella jiangningensis]
MSTDHQRYSTENQQDSIAKYAAQHGMVIVRTYADEGKSGLRLEGREALKTLIEDVRSGKPAFSAVLVYDISRWGRFQDADESAYYEYLCRRSGIRVFYCTEPFENDGSPMATIMKSVKRAMAGEYSRELSNKVFQGQCRLIELGFRQGGSPGYGLRRMLLDEQRLPKGQLGRGEKKSLQTDRVVLVPGPDDEIAIIRQIYRSFLEEGKPERVIADDLNAMGLENDLGRPWTRGTIHQILTNEKYVGNNVYNRTSFKLKQKRVRNAPDMWIRRAGAFDSIISPELFERVQTIISARSEHLDSDTMLHMLRELYEKAGILSGLLIDEQDEMPSSHAYSARFGGLIRAYALIGFRPERDYRYIEINRSLRQMLPEIVDKVISDLERVCLSISVDAHETGLMLINGEFTLSIVLSRCIQLTSGTFRWKVHFDTSLAPDITIVARLSSDQRTILDYYLFPRIDLPLRPLRLAEENNAFTLDAYRFDSLDPLFALADRAPLQWVA